MLEALKKLALENCPTFGEGHGHGGRFLKVWSPRCQHCCHSLLFVQKVVKTVASHLLD